MNIYNFIKSIKKNKRKKKFNIILKELSQRLLFKLSLYLKYHKSQIKSVRQLLKNLLLIMGDQFISINSNLF